MNVNEPDGVALESVSHPIEVTEEMVAAGYAALEGSPLSLWPQKLKNVYLAMCAAAPVAELDINEDVLEVDAVLYLQRAQDQIERFAIRAAKGNNGGEWATHYTEEQKDYWRTFAADLILEIGTL